MKNKNVGNKTRSPPASLPFKGQGTEHTTVKWPLQLGKKKVSVIRINGRIPGRNS